MNTTSMSRGYISFYNLEDWWDTSFHVQQQAYIIERYRPLGSSSPLEGRVESCSQSAIAFLTGLADWFFDTNDRQIRDKIVNKANSLCTENTDVLDRHFLYSTMIKHYYKMRKHGTYYYQLAIEYCLKQIELSSDARDAFLQEWKSLPASLGYQQLVVIYEKDGKYAEAIDLCKKAEVQGWKGDWVERAIKLEGKLIKI